MKNLLLILILITASFHAVAQCALDATITTQDSRCAATGTITIAATGGSGSYNYQISNNSFTSSNVITGLSKGSYTVIIKDMNTDCSIVKIVEIGGNYNDIAFELTKEDLTCNQKVGSITLINITGGLAPFEYKVFNSTKNQIITSQSREGIIFQGLEAGEYNVQVKDSCGTIRVRQIKVAPYLIDFSYSYQLTGCDSLNVDMIPLPQEGKYIFGAKVNGDTTWSTSSNFSFSLQKGYVVTLLLKDSCGNVAQKVLSAPKSFKPHLDNPIFHFFCDSFMIDITSTGFKSNVTYCLWERDTVTKTLTKLVSCGLSHWKVPYGGYAIVASDGCNTDTATFSHPFMAEGVELNPFNLRCDKFDMKIQALSFGKPICLYDSTGKQIKCADDAKDDPTIKDLPYGRYCARIFDPCTNDYISICSTITRKPVIDISVTSYVECTYSQIQLMTNIGMDSSAPYSVWTYDDNNVLIDFGTTTTNTYSKYINANGKPIRVVVENQCGDRDTAIYTNTKPFAVDKSYSVIRKCPGASGDFGSSDIEVSATDNHYNVITPTLVRKDGVAINKKFDFRDENNKFYFYDVDPGTYVLRYFLYNCTLEIYDTITIEKYSYPMAVPSSIYKCDNNSYQLKATVVGGIQPFTYEIISSNPSTPTINKSQNNPQFIINNGTEYSLIRVRTVDACGNSATQDMSLLPLQNIKGYATDTCFYRTMKLSVDNIPEAQYRWYYVSEGMETLIGMESFYQTYFIPEKVGLYICKISVYGDCIQRSIRFDLQGTCYDHLQVKTKDIPGVQKQGEIKLFPNPSKEAIHILFNKKKAFDYKIEVIGASNGIVYYNDRLFGMAKKDHVIDKKFSPGLYLIKISNLGSGEVQIFKQIIF